MRRLLPVIVLCTVGMATHAHAQTPGLEETDIAPLADVISTMSDVEIMQMEQTMTDIGSLTPFEVSCYARYGILPIGRAEQVEQKRQNGLKGRNSMDQASLTIQPDLIARIYAVCDGEDDAIAIMATVAAELYHAVDGFDWVGFYRVVSPGRLKIGPYQGGHGCLVIPFDRGVCGAAARQQTIQIVDDVDSFDGHIACSSSTKSELVIPCFNAAGKLLGVLDIDSDRPAFFTAEDARQLDQMLRRLFVRTK